MTKLIAWYLPQFHRIPENDKWWGEGFTEWTSLQRWKPYYPGHDILRPHPDIGYYDLLDTNIRRKQAGLAKEYGIYGFCYYHYWFGDKLLLEKPLEKMLIDGQPDLPFCFCWVNESWQRTWYALNKSKEMLQEMIYGDEQEWERHLQWLLPFFKHKNYILQDGKPVLSIFLPHKIPNYEERIRYWKKRLQEEGFAGIHIVAVANHAELPSPSKYDAVAEFYPAMLWNKQYFPPSLLKRIWDKIVRTLRPLFVKNDLRNLSIVDTATVNNMALGFGTIHPHQYRGIMTGHDASPRVGTRRTIYTHVTPAQFGESLKKQMARSPEFVFINAWNEWGEGCVIEPDDKNGYAYLEAVRDAVKEASS